MPNKTDIAEKVAEKFSLDLKDAHVVLDIFFKSIRSSLKLGGRSELRGFGSFSVRKRKNSKKVISKYTYRGQDEYNVLYYRMSSILLKRLNRKLAKKNK